MQIANPSPLPNSPLPSQLILRSSTFKTPSTIWFFKNCNHSIHFDPNVVHALVATCWRLTCNVHLKDRGVYLQARIVLNYAFRNGCIINWMIHSRWKSNVNLCRRGFVIFPIKILPTCLVGWEEKTHFNIQCLFRINFKVKIFRRIFNIPEKTCWHMLVSVTDACPLWWGMDELDRDKNGRKNPSRSILICSLLLPHRTNKSLGGKSR